MLGCLTYVSTRARPLKQQRLAEMLMRVSLRDSADVSKRALPTAVELFSRTAEGSDARRGR